MIRIKEIQIERFRSIINISLQINEDSNLIAVCGQNNVGKTNLLRAINVFLILSNMNQRMICQESNMQQEVVQYILR